MTRPSKRSGTANIQFQKRIPKDVKAKLDKLPSAYRPPGWGKEFITISTGTADKRKAAAEFARIGADVEERFERLRSGIHVLSQKQLVALAGTVYRAWADALEENPGDPATWERVLLENVKARAGKFGKGPLLIGTQAQRQASMEDRFGELLTATLAKECLIIDQPTRLRLLDEIALALDQAALKLKKNASGDYRPYENAERFPTWENPSSPRKADKKLTLPALFDTWANHPEQKAQAPRTISRYRGVFDALDKFLKHPDAHEVSTSDIRRFTDALMTEGKLEPRTVKDVYKAAISSVFNWAIGKGIVLHNPATDVSIKVKKKPLLRPKELIDPEAFALFNACNSIPSDSAPRTSEAAYRWCPLICLYTGARIGEATQLRAEDFLNDAGVDYLRITPEAGTVKDGEYRYAPLHPRLIELGLLAFVRSAGDGPLFFDKATRRNQKAKTPQSELVARKITAWAKQTCLPDTKLSRPVHGTRHRFMTVARRAGIDPQYIEAITGHAPSGQNSHYGSFDISVLAREIRKLTAAARQSR